MQVRLAHMDDLDEVTRLFDFAIASFTVRFQILMRLVSLSRCVSNRVTQQY